MPTWLWVVFGLVILVFVALMIYFCVVRPGVAVISSESPLSPTGEPFSPSDSSSSSTSSSNSTGSSSSTGDAPAPLPQGGDNLSNLMALAAEAGMPVPAAAIAPASARYPPPPPAGQSRPPPATVPDPPVEQPKPPAPETPAPKATPAKGAALAKGTAPKAAPAPLKVDFSDDDGTESAGSSASSALTDQSQEMRDCQAIALDGLQTCQQLAGSDPAKMDLCWQQIHTQLAACVPSAPSSIAAPPLPAGPAGVAVVVTAALIFNENVPIGDRLDAAIEGYLACMDSEDKSNDRQSCVEQLFADINNSVDQTKLSADQQQGFMDAQNDLTDCLQQSTTIQKDFLCLRNFYATVVDQLKLPLIPLPKKAKRVYATNKAIATNCYSMATTTLRSCLESIKKISDPAQREQARQVCFKEYRDLLNSCLCLSYGPSDPHCPK